MSALFDQPRQPEEVMARFTVVPSGNLFVVHDREDGSDTDGMRLSSAVHLANQWNRQAEKEAS